MLALNGCFLFAIKTMGRVDTNSIMFVGPLIVTALSVPLLGERVGPRQWAAVVVGFVGAMIIIRPGTGAFQSVAVLPLMAAFAFAFYQISTRVLSRSDDPLTTLVSSACLPWYWQSPDLTGWFLLVMAGVFGALGQLSLIKAIASVPLPTIVPLNYLSLVWVTISGYALFGDLPEMTTIAGAAIIVGSGSYVLHREQVQAAKPATDSG